jgi:hypothetical protein
VIGGLLTSTLLTLLVLPAVYRLFPGTLQAAWGEPAKAEKPAAAHHADVDAPPAGVDADHQ